MEPTDSVNGEQLRDDSTGVDQRVRVAVCELDPRVALSVTEVSALTVPAVAVKAALDLLAETVTLAGTVTTPELELKVTVVFADTVCASVTVQFVVAFDISPVGLQTRDDTGTGAVRLTVVLAELPL